MGTLITHRNTMPAMSYDAGQQLQLAFPFAVEKVECPSQRLLLSLHLLEKIQWPCNNCILSKVLLQAIQQVIGISGRGVIVCFPNLSHLSASRKTRKSEELKTFCRRDPPKFRKALHTDRLTYTRTHTHITMIVRHHTSLNL